MRLVSSALAQDHPGEPSQERNMHEFGITFQNIHGETYDSPEYVGLTLPFRPNVGDEILIVGAGGKSYRVLKVEYCAGPSFGDFLLTVEPVV